jgi:acetyl-CoA C-acetyltransferase
MTNVVILSGARTAIGSFGGSLSKVSPIDMSTATIKASLERAGVIGEQIGHVAIGHVINTESRDAYLSRVASINAGISDNTPAMNVNRLCGSGLQAIISITQSLLLGDTNFGVAGGSENMSQAPYVLQNSRWGQKMGDTLAQDMLLAALQCPFGTGHMGVTAENVAQEHSISRSSQDIFALESQRRADIAINSGYFEKQIIPIEVKHKREKIEFKIDEHPKLSNLESLSILKPAFQKDGSVTPGNASGLNDGAGALVLATEEAANSAGLTPKARILGYAHAGVRPEVMGIGPVPAVQSLLKKTGLSISDFDVIESNEAFASQALAVNKNLKLNPKKVNPNGGAIALGHPIGATGAIIAIKALYELERTNSSKALITMCIGGGQGIALAIERMS